jgi:hypothetical protein
MIFASKIVTYLYGATQILGKDEKAHYVQKWSDFASKIKAYLSGKWCYAQILNKDEKVHDVQI